MKKASPPPSALAALLAAVVLAAAPTFADIAPYPGGGPGFSMRWRREQAPETPPAPAPETPPAADDASDTLSRAIGAASMPQLHRALLEIAPADGEAAKAFMEALYRDRKEKLQSGRITPRESRQLEELSRMAGEGLLDAP